MTIEEAQQILDQTPRGQAVGHVLKRLFEVDVIRLTPDEKAAVIILIWEGMANQTHNVFWALRDF